MCSTITSEWPTSNSASKQSNNRTISEKCRPVVGSSSTNSVRPFRLSEQIGGQLEPLGLAAGERGGRLAEPQVVEPHVDQVLEPRLDLFVAAEKRERLAGRHVEHFRDVDAAILHVEHRPSIAFAATLAAPHVDVGHELHVDGDVARPLAGLAPPAGHVEAEGPRREPTGLGVRLFGKHGPNQVERLDVGQRVRPRRAADRRLIDQHDVFQLAGAEYIVELERRPCRSTRHQSFFFLASWAASAG